VEVSIAGAHAVACCRLLGWGSRSLDNLEERLMVEFGPTGAPRKYELIYEVVRITARRWTPTLAVDGGHFDEPAVRSWTHRAMEAYWALAPK